MRRLWLVFDLDETLCFRTGRPCADTREILDHLYGKGIPIALASYHLEADRVLRDNGLLHYFRALEFGRGVSKLTMLQRLAARTHLSLGDVVFFDDLRSNIEPCLDACVAAVQVDPAVGVTLHQVLDVVADAEKPRAWISLLPGLDGDCIAYLLSHYDLWHRYRTDWLDSVERNCDEALSAATLLSTVVAIEDEYGASFVIQIRDRNTKSTAIVRSATIRLDHEPDAPIDVLTAGRVREGEFFEHTFLLAIGQLERRNALARENRRVDIPPVTGPGTDGATTPHERNKSLVARSRTGRVTATAGMVVGGSSGGSGSSDKRIDAPAGAATGASAGRVLAVIDEEDTEEGRERG